MGFHGSLQHVRQQEQDIVSPGLNHEGARAWPALSTWGLGLRQRLGNRVHGRPGEWLLLLWRRLPAASGLRSSTRPLELLGKTSLRTSMKS